ncbi:MAG: response regulator transcription factor [Helicobacter sp.]|nr:response regulator transcription factor [Helicobacter sp.]
MAAKILLVEDDPFLAEMVEEFLGEEGYDVCVCGNAKIALQLALEESFDVWILDIKLPSGDGFSLLQTLRKKGIATPAIYTTSLGSIQDLQKGFESGCDDYLRKPFELKELLLRIQKILQASFSTAHSLCEDLGNGLQFFYAKKALFRAQQKIPLTGKETDLLALFLQNKNRFMSYEEIFAHLWGFETPSEMSLRAYVKHLRALLGKDKITNHRGRGYCYEP